MTVDFAYGLVIVAAGMAAGVGSAFVETDDYRRPLRNAAGIALGGAGILAVWFGGYLSLLNLPRT